jgi:hypothetical protein
MGNDKLLRGRVREGVIPLPSFGEGVRACFRLRIVAVIQLQRVIGRVNSADDGVTVSKL